MTAPRTAWVLGLVAACAALFGLVLIRDSAAPDQPVSSPSVRDGWKTIEYRGVQVDIPSTWDRLDKSDCELKFEQWAPPESSSCRSGVGAAFYGAATFDPFHRPGVWPTDTKGADAGTWNGYVYVGDYAVYALHTDRDVVQAVLDSAKMAGSPNPGQQRTGP